MEQPKDYDVEQTKEEIHVELWHDVLVLRVIAVVLFLSGFVLGAVLL